jgi:hypothetical protein
MRVDMPRDAVAVVDARFLNARRQGPRRSCAIWNEILENAAHLSGIPKGGGGMEGAGHVALPVAAHHVGVDR